MKYKIKIKLLFLFILIAGSTYAQVPVPYTVSGDDLSPTYKVEVNGVDVFTTRFAGLNYARCAYSGIANILITVNGSLTNYVISPKRLNIISNQNSNTIAFTINTSLGGYFLLQADGLEDLAILIDPPIINPLTGNEPNVIDASQWLTNDGGAADQTAKFNSAISAANNTGKILYIPAGTYHGKITIYNRSNFDIYFAPGCLIMTPIDHGVSSNGMHITSSSNINILGSGVIDHTAWQNFYGPTADIYNNPTEVNNHENINGNPLRIYNSQNISVEGLLVRNARSWNVAIKESDNITLRHCKSISPGLVNPVWTDGFNITSTHNSVIENCFAYVHDDCFASGHYFTSSNTRDNQASRVKRLLAYTAKGNGVRLGFETNYDQGDFTFEESDFILPGNTKSCVRIHELGNDKKYGVVRFSNCGFERVADMLSSANALLIGTVSGSTVEPTMGNGVNMEKLELDHVTFDFLRPSLIYGSPKIDTLAVTNLVIADQQIKNSQAALFTLKDVTKEIWCGDIPTTLSPTDDSYIRRGVNSGNNYGISDQIIIKNSPDPQFTREVVLKFDVSKLSTVSNATLRVYMSSFAGFGGSTSSTINLYAASTDSWSEGTVTANSIARTGNIIASENVGTTVGYYEWDITNFVNSEISGDGFVSVVMVGQVPDDNLISFNSKEFNATKEQPELIYTPASSSSTNKASQNIEPLNYFLGENKLELQKTSVFPNPCENVISVTTPDPLTSISLIDLSGKVIKTLQWNNDTNTKIAFDLSGSKSGIYLLQLNKNDGRIEVRKIVKK